MGVGGNIECDQIAVYHSDSNIRSLASTRIDNITVIAAGTDEGKLLQVASFPLSSFFVVNEVSRVEVHLKLHQCQCESYKFY